MSIKKIIKNKMAVKKIIKTKILCLVFFIPVFSYSAWQGAGTETDPYLITSRECLEALADSISVTQSVWVDNWSKNKYFILMQDITDSVRTMIGFPKFQGHFNGQNYKITLAIDNQMVSSNVGLFARVDDGATLSNIVVDGYVNGGSNGLYVAGAVGYCLLCTLTNITNLAAVNVTRHTTNAVAGGVVAYLNQGYVISSINLGNITGTAYLVGGIAGRALGATIMHCINYNFLKENNGFGGRVGGIVGVADGGCTISNNFNSGVVEGGSNSKVGCIVGLNDGGTVINNHYDKQMCGEEE